ncbi:MAG: hypothetical protein V2I40_11370, partial [Desulfobacteraceae bacterium]|nr:hypothetical protein [Desulfobacteraceae bacterium]
NLVLLVVVLRNKLGVIRWRLIFSSCLKTLAASGLMALGVVMTCRLLIPPETATGSLRLLAGIGAGILGGIAIFSAAAWMMKIPEWQKVMVLMKRSLNRS